MVDDEVQSVREALAKGIGVPQHIVVAFITPDNELVRAMVMIQIVDDMDKSEMFTDIGKTLTTSMGETLFPLAACFVSESWWTMIHKDDFEKFTGKVSDLPDRKECFAIAARTLDGRTAGANLPFQVVDNVQTIIEDDVFTADIHYPG